MTLSVSGVCMLTKCATAVLLECPEKRSGGAIPVTKRVMGEAPLPDIVLTVPLLVEAQRPADN